MKQTLDLWPSRTKINLVDPDPADYCIEDIAWGVSWEMRFANHIPRFYSVAEHLVHAAEIAMAIVAESDPIVLMHLPGLALLHDAVEGVGWRDLPSPVKALLPEYKKYEAIHQRAINQRFGLPPDDAALHARVKAIDNHLYELEHSALRLGRPLAGVELQYWSPEESRERFMEAFRAIFPEKVW